MPKTLQEYEKGMPKTLGIWEWECPKRCDTGTFEKQAPEGRVKALGTRYLTVCLIADC